MIKKNTKSSLNLSYTEEYCKCVLVTGGVGFVGSHIAETLLKEGRNVVVFDLFNSETSKSNEKLENAEILKRTAEEYKDYGASLNIVRGNIADQDLVISTVKKFGVTACIHVAAMADDRRSVNNPDDYILVNVLGTAKFLDALGKAGIKMVVQASTRSVFGQRDNNELKLSESADRRPINPYGASKVGSDAMAHCYSHMYNMNVTLIRIYASYGPRGRVDMIPRILVENIYHDKPIRKFGDGTATRTWIYVSDIVSAFLLALKKPQKGYAEFNTGTPNSTTLNEIIASAEKVSGKKAIIEHHPVPPGDAHTVGHPNFDKIKKVLGWEPMISVEEGMRLLYEDYASSMQMEKAV